MPRGMLTVEYQLSPLHLPESIWVAVRRRNKSHGWRTRCVMAFARMLGFREKCPISKNPPTQADHDYADTLVEKYDIKGAE